MDDTDLMHFWVYDGEKIDVVEYVPSATQSTTGMMGFKYGTMNEGVFYTHTCWDQGNELVKFDIDNKTIETIKTDLPLGAKPVVSNKSVYLFPSVGSPYMDAAKEVYKIDGNSLVKHLDLPTTNLTYGPINDSDSSVLMVPYRFDLNESMKLDTELTIIDLDSNEAHSVNVELELE
jgi:hypothetical protein